LVIEQIVCGLTTARRSSSQVYKPKCFLCSYQHVRNSYNNQTQHVLAVHLGFC